MISLTIGCVVLWMSIMAVKMQGEKQQLRNPSWKEVFQVTTEPCTTPVKLEDVPSNFDWKFLGNRPHCSKRYHVSLEKELPLGPAELREIFNEKFRHQVTKLIDAVTLTAVKDGGMHAASECKFHCSIHLGKIAWSIADEIKQKQNYFTLQSFSHISQIRELPKPTVLVKEDFFSCVIPNARMMLAKLKSDYKFSAPKVEHYLYLQLFSREEKSIMYRVKVIEEQTKNGSTFHVADIWSPKTLVSAKNDFMCFGRSHDVRISCRCATDELSEDVRKDIEAVANSCTRKGNLEMILKTDKVVVGRVFDRNVHKFLSCDGWVVNHITQTDHVIDKDTQPVGVVTPLPEGHPCQDIEVMLQEIHYSGPDKREEIKEKVLKMVHFSLDVVDMAEECLNDQE